MRTEWLVAFYAGATFINALIYGWRPKGHAGWWMEGYLSAWKQVRTLIRLQRVGVEAGVDPLTVLRDSEGAVEKIMSNARDAHDRVRAL